MLPHQLAKSLQGLPLQAVRYYASIGSTNIEAMRWAEAGASSASLVVADEQTAGRGRMGRSWLTPPGAALAFSLVLRPDHSSGIPAGLSNRPLPLLFSGLGAVAVCQALEALRLAPQIKWPNDVLLENCKVCGVLVEAAWQARADDEEVKDGLQQGFETLPALGWIVIGIGVNVTPASVPPPAATRFPATCVEAELGQTTERWKFLRSILQRLFEWLPRLDTAEYLYQWESRLAWRNQRVAIVTPQWQPGEQEFAEHLALEGSLLGLDALGGLRLAQQNGQVSVLTSGEVSLRLKSSQ
jgi:BirA family biotin operon repressor/biotin-[acetyl-CoA-carboxylase] ligase